MKFKKSERSKQVAWFVKQWKSLFKCAVLGLGRLIVVLGDEDDPAGY